MIFTIDISEQALSELENLPLRIQLHITRKINQVLKIHPYPHGNNPKRLKGEKLFRLRVGDYRVVYQVMGVIVKITNIGHRKDIYRDI